MINIILFIFNVLFVSTLLSIMFFVFTKKKNLKNKKEENEFNKSYIKKQHFFNIFYISSSLFFLLSLCFLMYNLVDCKDDLEKLDKVVEKQMLEPLEESVYMIGNKTNNGGTNKFKYFSISNNNNLLVTNYECYQKNIVLDKKIEKPYKEVVHYYKEFDFLTRLLIGIKDFKQIETKYYISEKNIKFETNKYTKGDF